jgi:hypothetical protein
MDRKYKCKVKGESSLNESSNIPVTGAPEGKNGGEANYKQVKTGFSRVTVAHVCNPNYMRG